MKAHIRLVKHMTVPLEDAGGKMLVRHATPAT